MVLVTGGTIGGKKLQSVEEYNGRECNCGRSLPMRTAGHCQIQAGNITIMFGKYIVFLNSYVYPFLYIRRVYFWGHGIVSVFP